MFPYYNCATLSTVSPCRMKNSFMTMREKILQCACRPGRKRSWRSQILGGKVTGFYACRAIALWRSLLLMLLSTACGFSVGSSPLVYYIVIQHSTLEWDAVSTLQVIQSYRNALEYRLRYSPDDQKLLLILWLIISVEISKHH